MRIGNLIGSDAETSSNSRSIEVQFMGRASMSHMHPWTASTSVCQDFRVMCSTTKCTAPPNARTPQIAHLKLQPVQPSTIDIFTGTFIVRFVSHYRVYWEFFINKQLCRWSYWPAALGKLRSSRCSFVNNRRNPISHNGRSSVSRLKALTLALLG